MRIQGPRVEIRPIAEDELEAVLEVYRQCEDFLALGPQPLASMEMVLTDMSHSRGEGGLFCGIFDAEGKMIGIVDFVPGMYQGHPEQAFLSLLMIGRPYRCDGIGAEVVRLIEGELAASSGISSVLAGVQVNNPAAIRFWQRLGYQVVGEPELQPDRTTAVRIRKSLGDPGQEAQKR